MNLGLRDAIGLGPLLAQHAQVNQASASAGDIDKPLREYAAARHSRGLSVIDMTKSLIRLTKAFNPESVQDHIMSWLVWLLPKFRFVRNAAAWRLSGLGA